MTPEERSNRVRRALHSAQDRLWYWNEDKLADACVAAEALLPPGAIILLPTEIDQFVRDGIARNLSKVLGEPA